MPTRRSRTARLATTVVVAALALGVVPAVASAAPCPDVPASPVLAGFGDTNDYFLAPGGDFESGLWAGSGLERTSSASKPWSLAGPSVMRIGDNRSATSPVFCVSELHPHFRFMAKGDEDARLKVEAIENGIVTGLTVIGSDERWRLTGIVPLATALGFIGDESHNVQLRFTSLNNEWKIDGVYVDPYRR